MEGYVYVMSNKAMPGLVKVGFTTGTPEGRAAQLSGTHSPHPVVVEYSTHVPDARAVEREAHLRLHKHREGKEWFRCSRELAVNAIKHAAGDLARNEFSRVEQERQQAAYQEQARERRETEQRAHAEEQRKAGFRVAVEQHYGPRLANASPHSGRSTDGRASRPGS
ncbi:GIY-YIG nuclease family protein [Burkholderia gladioli pv. gladioli]|uniref:GIY-YIG nuclease family protein n=1 Tax=Burkholderia gladioli TaxID=28095 RepID=UPI001FC7CB17|nr:GIY-YIG nuclease family protein [Burkholderia gladioli]MDJ1160430.1 GIY-YIG nuclease family protein [Burkholderia gladioli pv. gladioli]